MLRLLFIAVAMMLMGSSAIAAAPPSTASLTVPATVVAGAEYTVSGSGFTPGAFIAVLTREPDITWFWNGRADDAGAFSYVRSTSLTSAGATVRHDAYEQKQGNHWKLKASATTTVLP